MTQALNFKVTGSDLLQSYKNTRNHSQSICANLTDEDVQAQSMADASPLKWHLAHTTWAFETFILKPFVNDYRTFDDSYEYLFNSYYNAIGAQFPRPQRGLLTRPDRQTVNHYRNHVDHAMEKLFFEFAEIKPDIQKKLIPLIKLTINHEQQHQELMLTDLKHLFSFNPQFPVYSDIEQFEPCEKSEAIRFEAGQYSIGHQQEEFYFDNEGPQHQCYLQDYTIDSHLISNGDFLEFINDGGYQSPQYWLSEAWQKINQNSVSHPLYWKKIKGQWHEYTLNGLKPVMPRLPVKHVNFFEANAFANWRGKRLPTEQEWETAVRSQHPQLKQCFGQLWQWTSSSYSAYPGFKPLEGAVGEYNGKFMVNQYVLRGGSIATPANHIRPSYRNFFYPDASWQFSGIRLAESI
ncbi:ergothioneine biosynthesis protein EgtB [Aliikangiella coralliicola]|uniref:Ergothioneine biosynthesis protein EgtB n=1 Tax=Aliikangiella coralliicola TaxID=2592383 RepID=A0A545UBW0_9GAMM|nr:ergothioneine biosynthesis protein EgtB [Aliikangiella coralliicola]TQV86955.1 ergothioneine biosynthesis protein EgtB [Aliikangiella coralliicola]